MSDELAKKLKWKDFYENVIRDRQFCNTTCQIYTRCPLSIQSKLSNKEDCRVKAMDSDTRRRFVRLFVFGDDGLYDEAMSTLFDLSQVLDIRHNKKEMITYLDLVVKLARTFRGVVEDKTPQKLVINIEDYAKPVELVGPGGLVEEGEIVMKRDPDSLLESPNLENIVKHRETKGNIFT